MIPCAAHRFDPMDSPLRPAVIDGFIAEAGGEGEEDDIAQRSLHHARLDRRDRELDDQDLERIAHDISQRNRRTTAHYTGDMNDVPQRLLMPDVRDPNLWQVRVKVCESLWLNPSGAHTYSSQGVSAISSSA